MKSKLGRVQLFHPETGERMLIPKPSSDPNDPLNWSKPYRHFICILAVISVFVGQFLCAGPSVAMTELAEYFAPRKEADGSINLSASISQISYAFTTYSLMQGTSNFFLVPLMTKYGRRPVFLGSYLVYLFAVVWCAEAKTYGSFLAARIVSGFFSGVNETIGPLLITDVCFLHERALYMALYNFMLNAGVSIGIIISGFLVYYTNWRACFYLGIGIIAGFWLIVLFCIPETLYLRNEEFPEIQTPSDLDEKVAMVTNEYIDTNSTREEQPTSIPKKKSYWQLMKFWSGEVYTDESLLKIFLRPIGLIVLPPVLWSSLVLTGTVGYVVGVSSNYSTAFSTNYGFNTWQVGLVWVGAVIGSLAGIYVGGPLFEKITDFFTNRNNGVREPEHRIPAIVIGGITSPLGLFIYGIGLDRQWHWVVPIIGYGIMSFGVVQATTCSWVYTIDSYRPIVGEVEVTQVGFKSLLGFLLNFYTNPWIDKEGYTLAFGEMAILGLVLIFCGTPLYWCGSRVRHATLNWKILQFIRWDDDREMGE